MKLFGAYMKEKAGEICVKAGIILIFLAVGFLQDVQIEAIKYASLLSVTLIIGVMVWDFYRYVWKHKELNRMIQCADKHLDDFPAPWGLLEKDYQELAQTIEQSKKDLAEKNFLAVKEMLEYYGMWIHQVKTPISAMNLMIQLLQDDFPQESRLREMNGELFKIEQYVEMVMTYLRTEEMSGDMDFRRCSLDDCICQTLRKYSGLFILKKIHLDFQPLEKEVLTDEKWLVFVLEQILSNAIKYTGVGGTISIYQEKENIKKGTTLVIEDTGIGIQAEDIPRIFERGFTGYNGRSSKKASGIGLYLSRKILDRLGHTIRIQSEPGKGTKVFLTIM